MFKNKAIKNLAASFAVAAGLASCTELPEARTSSGIIQSGNKEISHIVVDKSDRIMALFNNKGGLVKSYEIGLGSNPAGDKIQRGDGRTPEGTYIIDLQNPYSSFTLSLRISYPDTNDRKEARARGVNPGGDIFIHGQPTGTDDNWQHRRGQDWTEGCIAVSSADIREIYSLVKIGTPITIKP